MALSHAAVTYLRQLGAVKAAVAVGVGDTQHGCIDLLLRDRHGLLLLRSDRHGGASRDLLVADHHAHGLSDVGQTSFR